MTDPRGNTAATYNNAGNLLTQTDVTTRLITNSLNSLAQLTSVLDGSDNAHADYTYTVDGKMNTVTYPNGTKATYGYDSANRVTSLTHTKVSDGSLLVGYTATYDSGNRLTGITEQPSGDVTVFTYDNADNLLTETRTGTKPYSGTYTYDKSNRRKTALVIANGVTTHNGVYTYDAAGRLSQVVDSATGLTEVYTWNNDGTLARYPGSAGSGYTRVLTYNEEQHLTTIAHDFGGGNVVNAYAYGYAADGGRRWQKDLINSVWTWYPCGVACTAGESVEQTSNLTGNTWTTSALYLKSGSGCGANIIRRNSEYHHFDLQGYLSLASGAGASTLATRGDNRFRHPAVRNRQCPDAMDFQQRLSWRRTDGSANLSVDSWASNRYRTNLQNISGTGQCPAMGPLSNYVPCDDAGWAFCRGVCSLIKPVPLGCQWCCLPPPPFLQKPRYGCTTPPLPSPTTPEKPVVSTVQ